MSKTAGEVISDYLKEQVDRETQHRERLQTRAGIVITGSTAAVSALFAILAYAPSRDETVLHGRIRWFMYAGLLVFAVAIGLAVIALWPQGQYVLRVDNNLRHYLDDKVFWRKSSYSTLRVAERRLKEFESILAVNNRIAPLLLASQIAQGIGLLLVAIAVCYLFG